MASRGQQGIRERGRGCDYKKVTWGDLWRNIQYNWQYQCWHRWSPFAMTQFTPFQLYKWSKSNTHLIAMEPEFWILIFSRAGSPLFWVGVVSCRSQGPIGPQGKSCSSSVLCYQARCSVGYLHQTQRLQLTVALSVRTLFISLHPDCNVTECCHQRKLGKTSVLFFTIACKSKVISK
jgi:hypothetical protein